MGSVSPCVCYYSGLGSPRPPEREMEAMSTRAVRTGVSPVDRPTEWTTALVMLVTAAVAYYNDRDIAALIAVAAAVLPVLVTAVAAWWEKRHAVTVPGPVEVVGD